MSTPTIFSPSPVQNSGVRSSALGFAEVDALTDHQTIQAGQMHLLRGVLGRTTAACLAALNALADQDGDVLFATGNDAPEQIAKKLRTMARGFEYLDNDRVSQIQSSADLARIKIARTRTASELVEFVAHFSSEKSAPYLLIVDDLPLIDWMPTVQSDTAPSRLDVSREQQLSWFTRMLSRVADGEHIAKVANESGIWTDLGYHLSRGGREYDDAFPMAVLVTAQTTKDAIPGGQTLVSWSHLIVNIDLETAVPGMRRNARLTKSKWGQMKARLDNHSKEAVEFKVKMNG